QLPKTKITVIAGSRAAADVIDGSYLCNEVRILVPGRMSFYQLIRTFLNLRKEHFDLAIICTRISPRIAQLLKLFSGIKVIAGDSLPPRKWGYTHWTSTESNLHRVISNMKILQTIIPEAQMGSLYFHLDPESRVQSNHFWSQLGYETRNVLGIQAGVGSSQKWKRFPVEKFRIVIRMFLDKVPEARVIVFLGHEEGDLLSSFSGIDCRVSLASGLPLKTVGGIISKTRVLLAGDSALGHIASALGVPVITLAGPTNVDSTGPRGDQNVVVRTSEDLACMPCYGTALYGHCN
ncbi:MAG: glycosyltransferase family 9 protein, partial [Elusimicrobiota bacterium]|nr:glycosyltransferase family 9 protein [Elusimicrobiota bacterium]